MTRDEQVAKAVIEACAKRSEEAGEAWNDTGYEHAFNELAATLRAMPIADLVAALPKEEPDMFDKAQFEKAPCYICGYNGPGYYQPSTHKCAAIYHGDVAQPDDRAVFKAFALSQGFIDAEAAWKNKEAAQPDAEEVWVSRSLAERTAALFNSVDPNGQIAREWQEKLEGRQS